MTVILVVAVGIGFGLWGINDYKMADKIYKGKEIFSTEQEYAEFKYAIGQEEIKLLDCHVLSSSPPIVVDFTAYIPIEQEFAYGEYKGKVGAYSSIFMYGFLVLFVGTFLIWVIFPKELERA